MSRRYEQFNVFSYQWSYIDEDCNNHGWQNIIRMYGINDRNESVYLRIENFDIPLYITLPPDIAWTEQTVNVLITKLRSLNPRKGFAPVEMMFQMREKSHYANVETVSSGPYKYENKKFPFLLATFHSTKALDSFVMNTRKDIHVSGIGQIRLKCHATERTITPVLKYLGISQLPSAGWIKGRGIIQKGREKESTRAKEYAISAGDLTPMPEDEAMKMPIIVPKIMSFDIETNSTVITSMPKSFRPGDKVFQISYVVIDRNKQCRKVLLSLGEPSPVEGIIVKSCKTEADLLVQFAKDMVTEDPEVVMGFNILAFDINYMIERCKNMCRCLGEFDMMGCLEGKHATEESIDWGSSAYGKQKFAFLNAEGRVFIDLLPYIKRNYKLPNYRLETICSEFLKTNKDPLKAKDIFRCYRQFTGESLALCGKYCFVEGTAVATRQCSVPIEKLAGKQAEVLSWDDKSEGLIFSNQTKFFDNGVHECIELTLEDGRTISCTPDHKFMTSKGWIEAKYLQGKRVVCGINPPIRDVEKEFSLYRGWSMPNLEDVFSVKTMHDYERILAFSRILGYVITDGTLTKDRADVYIGHKLDVADIVNDIRILDAEPNTTRFDGTTYRITLPRVISKLFYRVKGLYIGRRMTGGSRIPDFLMNDDCPLSVIKEFLRGLFGGDGSAPAYSKGDDKFQSITFVQTKSRDNIIGLNIFMLDVQYLLTKFGVSSTLQEPRKIKSSRGELNYAIYLRVSSKDILAFERELGFAYCCHKNQRLAAAASFYRQVNINKSEGKKYMYAKEYLRSIGAEAYFYSDDGEKHSRAYAVDSSAEMLPTFNLKVIEIKNIGKHKVYDIEVDNTHSFVANGMVVHNCVQDSYVVYLLFDKLNVWPDLTESATVNVVPIFDMFTKGQQIKMYSQVYRYCFNKNIVIESNAYQAKDDEHYKGAYVSEPIKGLYKNVIPFDFASLYPNTMRAYNIDYSKLVLDESIPDEDCNVMSWEEHEYCLIEGTKVALPEGVSVPIEQLNICRQVLAHDTKQNGIVPAVQSKFFDQGMKPCVKVTLEDGTELICTPNHRLLQSDGTWQEAGKIPIGTRLKTSVRQPESNPKTEMLALNEWCIDIHSNEETMKLSLHTSEQYMKTLAFMRLYGYMLTDGNISLSHDRPQGTVFVGHLLDTETVVNDIKILSGIAPSPIRREFVWGINIPASLLKFYVSLGFPVGNKTRKCTYIPDFIMDERCPRAVVREFLGGLFGGDGLTPSYNGNKRAQLFSGIGFVQTKIVSCKVNLDIFMADVQYLVNRFGDFTGKVSEKYYDGKVTLTLRYVTENTVEFVDSIGFRYCCHKTQRATVACSFLSLRRNVFRQQQWVINRVKEIKDMKTGESVIQILSQVHEELRAKEPIYNEYYSLPNYELVIGYLKKTCKSHGNRGSFRKDKFPTIEEYLKSLNAWESFCTDDRDKYKHIYGVEASRNSLPVINLKVIDVRPTGVQHVFDITVDNHHNFIANQIVAHNCSCPKDIFPGKKAPKLKDGTTKRICSSYRYRWLKQSVSGKGIIPTLLENLLNARKKTRGIIKINENEIKVLKKVLNHEELSEENKEAWAARLKMYTEKKESVAAIELIIQKGFIFDLSLEDRQIINTRIDGLESLNLVLDKRQLAYKVNANSMYGACGAKKGYAPFLPAAMCVTYMGRVNINKVNDFVISRYGALVIYNDTDSCYCHFPQFDTKPVSELWHHCFTVVKDIKTLFPPEISLEFEEKIYRKFLILSKKRYAAKAMDEDGHVDSKLMKRGIILQRRDNCKILRTVYQDLIFKIFDNDEELVKLKLITDIGERNSLPIVKEIFDLVDTSIDSVFRWSYVNNTGSRVSHSPRDFVITKQVTRDIKEYKNQDSLPGHVYLAKKMQAAGMPIGAGTRIEYVICKDEFNVYKKQEPQRDKLTDIDYFLEFREILRLSYIDYLKQFISPLDQVMEIVIGIEDYVKTQWNARIQYSKVINRLNHLFRPHLSFEIEDIPREVLFIED